MLTLAWSMERTPLVVHTLNRHRDTDSTIDPITWSATRIIWELLLVAGGWVVACFVVCSDCTPTRMLKLTSRLDLLCVPLLFVAHIMRFPPDEITAVYGLFYFLDGGIRNMRSVLLAQCSPPGQLMHTIAFNVGVKSLAMMVGASISMVLFRVVDSPYRLIHLTSAVAYASSLFVLQFLDSVDCTPLVTTALGETKAFNPVTNTNVAKYLLFVFFSIPIAYAFLSFYEIWTIDEYHLSNAMVETSKFGINVLTLSIAFSIACLSNTHWRHRRWLVVACQLVVLITLAALLLSRSEAVLLAMVLLLIPSYQISRLINAAMFFDHVPVDNRRLTKWTSIALLSSLVTRCAELGFGFILDTANGFEVMLIVAIAVIFIILIISVCVALALCDDMVYPSTTPLTVKAPVL